MVVCERNGEESRGLGDAMVGLRWALVVSGCEEARGEGSLALVSVARGRWQSGVCK